MIHAHRPAHPLRHLIRYYYGLEGHYGAQKVLRPVPARSPPIIEFMFGTPFLIERLDHGLIDHAWDATLVGPKTKRCVNLFLTGEVNSFTIVFQPKGFLGVIGMPPEEMTNQDCDAPAVMGQLVTEMHERLAEKRSFMERVAVADAMLVERCRSRDVGGAAPNLADIIHLRRGSVTVAGLAERAGLSIRQLERRFRYEIGMPPKLYARIIRFEAALALKSRNGTRRWTDIAHELGYHDQMHMVHDFKRLSGETPNAIRDRLDMFVKPECDYDAQCGQASEY